MDANAQIRASLETGVKLEGGSGLMELWDFLQLKCASFINSDLPGLGQAFTQPPGKPLRRALDATSKVVAPKPSDGRPHLQSCAIAQQSVCRSNCTNSYYC